MQSQLLNALPQGADAFNKVAERALKAAPLPPAKHRDVDEEMARRIMPEHLLPKGTRLVDQPPQVIKTRGVPVGDPSDLQGAHRHEFAISSADRSGRHALQLTISEGGEKAISTSAAEPAEPFAQLSFFVHGPKRTQDFLRQWEKLQHQEQRSRARAATASAAHASASAAHASAGQQPNPGAHRAHALAAAASAAAAAAASDAALRWKSCSASIGKKSPSKYGGRPP